MANKKKIGLALGCGGARGLAHLGVLKVLARENIKADMIAGSSMGALVGACYALGLDLEKIEKEIADMNKHKAVRKFIDLSARNCLIKGNKIFNYINELIKGARFSDTKIPLRIIATDLASGEETVFSKGDIAEAIQASICVPGIFPPVKIGDKYFIDGGVANPTPLDVVEKMGADVLIGVDLVSKRKVSLENPGIMATLLQSYEIIRNQAVKMKLEKISKDAIIIKPKLRGSIDSFKFYDAAQFIASGEDAAKENLTKIKKKLAE